eukprot:3933351-Rhodomonas_salina.1
MDGWRQIEGGREAPSIPDRARHTATTPGGERLGDRGQDPRRHTARSRHNPPATRRDITRHQYQATRRDIPICQNQVMRRIIPGYQYQAARRGIADQCRSRRRKSRRARYWSRGTRRLAR